MSCSNSVPMKSPCSKAPFRLERRMAFQPIPPGKAPEQIAEARRGDAEGRFAGCLFRCGFLHASSPAESTGRFRGFLYHAPPVSPERNQAAGSAFSLRQVTGSDARLLPRPAPRKKLPREVDALSRCVDQMEHGAEGGAPGVAGALCAGDGVRAEVRGPKKNCHCEKRICATKQSRSRLLRACRPWIASRSGFASRSQ